MRKYGESKTTRIMMATVPHVTSSLGLRKFQADGFLLTRVYHTNNTVQDTTPCRMRVNKLQQKHIRTNVLQLCLSVDSILLGIYHQTALQLSEKTGLTHTLTYTDLLLAEHECLMGRNYQEKKLEIPSQEVHGDDILPFLELEIKLKMSCDITLHINSLKYYTTAIM